MTHITMNVPGRNSSLEFVGRGVQSIKSNLVERLRRWRKYRTVAAELRQYSASEIVELGIARADIDYIADDAIGSLRRRREVCVRQRLRFLSVPLR